MFHHSKYVLILIMLLPVFLWSNSVYLRGVVKNAESGEMLAGVNISVKNSNVGTTTDVDGYFELNFEADETVIVEFQFIGYAAKTVEIREIKDWLEVNLTPEMLRSEPVVVTGVRAEKRKSPVPFTSLNREYIKENYGAQDVPMLLKEIPGVYAYSDNGTGVGYSYLKIRGFDAKRVSVMINGIPHNDPEEHSVYWVDMPDLAESATSLQVQRGVGISPYAISSFGGSVNLLTTGIPTKFGPEVTFGIGSYNTQKYAVNANTKLNDNYYTTFRLSKIKTDGYRERSGVDLWSYYFKLVRTGDKSFTQLNIYGGNEKTHAAWGYSPDFALKDNHKHNPYTYHNYIDNFDQPHYELINSYQLSPKLNIQNTLFYIHGEGYYEQLKDGQDLWEYGLISKPDSITSDLIRQKWVKKDQTGWVSQINWNHNKNNTLTAGMYLSDYSSLHYGEIEDIFNPFNEVTSGYISQDLISLPGEKYNYYRYVHDKKYYNFYLMEKGTLFNNKLTWQANVYFQNIDFSFKHRKAGNFESTNLHAYDVNYTHFSPRLGINYNINKNWNSYLSFSTAEKEPNADDLFDKWYGADDLGISPHFAKSDTIYRNGNIDHIKWQDPYVKEEKLIDIEAGVGYRSSLLQTELNLFRMYFKDEIVPFGAVDDDGYDVKGNADETIHEGFELSFYLKRGKHFAFSQNISYSNNYFNKFEQEDLVTGEKKNHSGKTISGFPDWLANTSVYFNYNNFIIKLTERYVGRIYLDNTEDKERSIDPTGKFLIFNPSGDIFNTNNLTETNNYLLDFQMSYKIPNTILKMNTNIILQINNLFNNKYYTAGYYGWDKLNGEYHLTNWMLPAATRNFLLTFRMNM